MSLRHLLSTSIATIVRHTSSSALSLRPMLQQSTISMDVGCSHATGNLRPQPSRYRTLAAATQAEMNLNLLLPLLFAIRLP